MQLLKETDHQRIGRFLIGGGSATLVHFLVMALCVSLGVHAVAATAIGMVAGAVYNYLFQYYFVFHSNQEHPPALIRYGVTVGLYFITNVLLFTLFYHIVGLGVFWSQILATAVVALQNYWMYKHFVCSGEEVPFGA